MKIAKIIKPADFVTLSNAVCGLVSIGLVFHKQFGLAAGFLLLAMVFDFFDGKVARWTKQSNELGMELDSLADAISFGAAPALFAFGMTNVSAPYIVAYLFFVCCGILRLARFNVSNIKGGFEGMPITVNGLLIPVLYFLSVPLVVYPILLLISGCLMISTIKIKKLG